MASSTPDITPAQILAIAGWIVAQLVAYGVLTSQTSQLALSGLATVMALALKWADAHVRRGRALVKQAENMAYVAASTAGTTNNVANKPS